MKLAEIVKKLKSMHNPKNIAGMARFGIVGKQVLGISIYVLRDMAKSIGKDHILAGKLWATGIHEVRILGVFVEEVDKVTPEQMDEWALDFESWDDTDQTCISLFDKTPYAWDKVYEWAERDELFVKRGAFSIIAGLAVHDKKASDEDFIKLFPLIKKHAIDERNYVKKAINWALRNIGKRNLNLNKRAIKFAAGLKQSSSKAAKWVGSNAYNELTSDKVQKRLKK